VTTDHRDGRSMAAEDKDTAAAWPGQAAMAGLPAPPLPAGLAAQLANRALVYLRPEKISAVWPHLDPGLSGMILAAGDGLAKAVRVLQGGGATFPVLTDSEGYRRYTATRAAPFRLPGADGLLPATLDSVLDAQLHAGATVALTPTGYIAAADTDVLKTAIDQFAQLDRTDAIFLAPLDISLIGRGYFQQTEAILADFGRPVAVVLGSQGNPLDHSKDITPNLRKLACRVPLIPIRTDFNGLDLLGQGAVCAAIGTGGQVRHTVDPAEKDRSFNPGPAPSVLWPELLTYFKGSTIAELFGARPQLAPSCGCAACQGRRLTRFLRREHQDEAIGHGVAVLLLLAARLLSEPTVRGRAERWKLLCSDAVDHHQVVLDQLNRLDGLKPQPSLKRWAALPA
jgi:hypothetical protein